MSYAIYSDSFAFLLVFPDSRFLFRAATTFIAYQVQDISIHPRFLYAATVWEWLYYILNLWCRQNVYKAWKTIYIIYIVLKNPWYPSQTLCVKNILTKILLTQKIDIKWLCGIYKGLARLDTRVKDVGSVGCVCV